ncbi:hypothetical protein ACWD5R_45210 [Streptomyces sp. NPDC002514]|uniref:hypothetical protein n=1 Tax=Streptomyces sp. NPDC001270 TaxID=3364554 RepID=UPI00369F6EC4
MPSNNDKSESREAKKRRTERERLQRKRETPGYADAERQRRKDQERERNQERQADPQGYEAQQMERRQELSRRQMDPEYRAQRKKEADRFHQRAYQARKRGDQPGRRPVVVELEVPQMEGGPSGASLPSFSPYAGQGADVHGLGEAQPGYPEPMFDDADVNAIMEEATRSGLHGADAASAALGSWSGPVDAVALDVSGYGGYAHAEGSWQAQPPGVDALSQGMQEMTIAAPVSAQGYEVAFSSWGDAHGAGTGWSAAYSGNTAAGHALVPQATEHLLSAPSADWSAWEAGDEVPVARRVSANRPGRSQGR